MTYTPAAGYTGPDSFTFTVTDTTTSLTSSPATVNITVQAQVNGPFVLAWNGSVSSDWFNPSNWTDINNSSNHVVPTAVDTVVITGGSNATVLDPTSPLNPNPGGTPTIAGLQMANGFLTLKGSLTDTGNFYQDQGFVNFAADADLLTVDGTFTHLGGIDTLNGLGTFVLAGTVGQNVTYKDSSVPAHALPNLTIANTSAAGVTVAPGSTLVVQNLNLFPGATVNLSVLTPNNTTAPLVVGGTLTAGNTDVFNLTVGSASVGNVYKFIQFGSLAAGSATYNIFGTGTLDAALNMTPPFVSVTVTAFTTYDWNGSASSDWFNPANWTDVNNPAHHAVPTAVDTAVITGGSNATVLDPTSPLNPNPGGTPTVGGLQVSNGFLTLKGSLTDTGNYHQDQGFINFAADADLLTVDGTFTHLGGVFGNNPNTPPAAGTVVLAGTVAQLVIDTSGHACPT